MKRVVLSVVMLVLLWPVAVQAADTRLVRLDGGNAEMKGLPLFVDGNSVGVVGDTIAVGGANRTLSVRLRSGVLLDYELTFSGQALMARESSSARCTGATSWAVLRPASLAVRPGQVTSIELVKPSPVYLGVCTVSLPNLECRSKTVSLQINSVPEVRADIAIDGVGLNATTSRQLDIGFCEGGATLLTVALSKPGFASCSTVVDINATSGVAMASCAMRRKSPQQLSASASHQ